MRCVHFHFILLDEAKKIQEQKENEARQIQEQKEIEAQLQEQREKEALAGKKIEEKNRKTQGNIVWSCGFIYWYLLLV